MIQGQFRNGSKQNLPGHFCCNYWKILSFHWCSELAVIYLHWRAPVQQVETEAEL
jgi:hypothetical protein